MRRTFSLFLLCFGLALPAMAKSPAPVLAIFSIENRGTTLTSEELDNLSDYLSTKLGECGQFQIVPRSELRKRLLSQKKDSHKECYDEACQVELGREMAAEQSLSTSISRVGSLCLLQANLYDLKQATSIKSASAKRACDADAMVSGVEELAAKLDGSWKAVQTATPAPRVDSRPRPPIQPVTSQAPPRREKHVWAALAWSLLPGGGLYYTNHVGWGVTYSITLGLSATAGAVFMTADNADLGLPLLYVTAALWGVSMLHASLAALVWEDPDYVSAGRDFRPVDQEERAACAPALVLPVWQGRF